MTLLACQIFSSIAHEGSFARTAEQLHLTPSAISHAGKQWETAFRLHGRNRMTDGGGGQVQLLRGAGKAALVRNGGK